MNSIKNAELPNIKVLASLEFDGMKFSLGGESIEAIMADIEILSQCSGMVNPFSKDIPLVEKLEKKLSEAVEANNYAVIENLTKAIQRLKSVN